MAESYVDIVNRALSRIKHAKRVSDLSEAAAARSVEVEQARLWYAITRDQVLRRHGWPFATVRAKLALVAGVERTDFAHAYAAPPRMLAARFIARPGERNPRHDQRPPYLVEAHVDADGEVIGKLVITDQDDAELVYTVRVENPQVFDPDFESAYTWLLAGELARGIAKDERLALSCTQAAEYEIRQAAAAALREGTPDPEPASAFEAARS